jgi:4-nitrophenyl phosphatase
VKSRRRRAAHETPRSLAELGRPIRGLILDLDGVLWKDDRQIGDLPVVFREVDRLHLLWMAVTNNATKTVQQYVEKLAAFGVVVSASQILTSGDATADILARRLRPGSTVYVAGEEGLIAALRQRGFEVIVDPADDRPVSAVVAGFDRGFTYARLLRAMLHIRSGALFYGTNPDPTFPVPSGLAPGAGAVLAAITAASEKSPRVIGKPSPLMFRLAVRRMRLPAKQILVVGDRLTTDIAAGQALRAPTALVLSGVTSAAQGRAWRPAPEIIARDLTQVLGL